MRKLAHNFRTVFPKISIVNCFKNAFVQQVTKSMVSLLVTDLGNLKFKQSIVSEMLFQLGKTKSRATNWRPGLAKSKRSHFT